MLKSTIFSFTCCIFMSSQSVAQCTSSGTNLVAPYASNSTNKGVMFDITATNTVTIYCFDANLPALSIGGYEIYFKAGTYVGSETNSSDWALIGSEGSLLSVGLNLGTPLSIPINKVIAAGQTVAFYITASNPILSTGLLTTSNSGYTAISSNPDMTVYGGAGVSYPFGTVTNNRSFNGTVHYELGSSLPVEFLDFTAVKVDQSVLLEWETESEHHSDYYEVERSSDAINWNRLLTTKAVGESTDRVIYQKTDLDPLDGISYYRLNQYDLDGSKTHLKTVSFNNQVVIDEQEIRVFPNPATDRFRVFGDQSELETVHIFTTLGEDISGNLVMDSHDGFTEIMFKDQLEGVFIVKTKTKSQVLIKK